ncbi:hypothetical protein SLS62_004439 [Diatrype stigma]|uniref:Uncharacterized protein n=1 Tax=Diatrype stigma TaxID=117547 RepID=A0AAN9UTC0_9PEZI
MESLTFGAEFEFVADIRHALPSNHDYIKEVEQTKAYSPGKNLKYAGKALKQHLERTAGLSHPVELSAKIVSRENPLGEEEKAFSAWIVKADLSIRSDMGSPASGNSKSSDERLFEMSDDSSGSDERDQTV